MAEESPSETASETTTEQEVRFHSDELDHGFFQLTLPLSISGWLLWILSILLLGGAIITETVFAWPGVGRLAVDALIQRDWPVVRTVILLAAFLLVLINVLIDIIYAWIDKRVQFQ